MDTSTDRTWNPVKWWIVTSEDALKANDILMPDVSLVYPVLAMQTESSWIVVDLEEMVKVLECMNAAIKLLMDERVTKGQHGE